MKGCKKLLVGIERPVPSAGLEFLNAIGNPPIYEGLWLKYDSSFFSTRFQDVPDGDSDLFPHPLRDDDLVFVLDGNDGHFD